MPTDNGNGTANASGNGRPIKEAALEEVKRLVRTGEINLAAASEKLRRTFGFTHAEINNPALIAFLTKQ